MAKSKDEKDFIMFRIKRKTHQNLKKINVLEQEGVDKNVPLYQTLDNLVEVKKVETYGK